ncbi:serine/arginine-rich SC35-like splicing factor SCL28 isoform X1 [Impatiens glandulifera]|uniref:serine/arginine-rich SC35-like splicing factor SCL28 isoform X1 n=1 Tax=Impatiens glandulifera TaxID=253017 RepID=UPI001FB13AE1|nr:serine/arginine-rich SC35-like splicing factor SCL28 isoform X1 [Impatiens glandulifera]XP_047323850.1 serine/arginine-rich SC35-like splicing factor SCL28 isoform X1 [Impatiens glandulifera]
MGRHRSRSHSPRRSRSRSHSPRRSKRYDDPRESRSRRDRRSPAPSGLLVRNISLDARQEDLRIPFERFGPIKDIYLPKDYYTGEPRGFGFVKFKYGDDAVAAKEHLNCTVIGGREIRIVFAEENRKTPQEMRRVTRPSGRERDNHRRRSPERSSRRRNRSYSRSASPVRSDIRNRRSNDDYSPRRSRSISQSRSPIGSPQRSGSRPSRSRSRHEERNHRSTQRSSLSPKRNGTKSPTPGRDHKLSPSPSPVRDTHSPARSRS